ncbi:MAG: sulfite exporter TauE/SafE family protein [Planctomycetes bacterium]|nr:sulfite exporter TauE/SafE family protein [Planctomycetota bacterium]
MQGTIDLIQINTRGSGISESIGKRVEAWGVWGSLPLGVVFALAFCPGSAVLFFGNLVPLAVKFESALLLPLTYGAGTALPVVLFAVLIVVSTSAVGRAYDRMSQFEWWARRATGTIFVVIGVYFTLKYIFRVL